MKYTYVGKSYVVSDAVKEYSEKRFDRLSNLLSDGTDVKLTFSVTKLEQKVEVTVKLDKRTIRCEVKDKDMYVAIDKAVDVLYSQVVKYKDRIKTKSKVDKRYQEEFETTFDDASFDADSPEPQIVKSKKFAMKPMDIEEAVIELDLLGHEFYMFLNSKSNEVNVVYRRADGDYGLIEPQF